MHRGVAPKSHIDTRHRTLNIPTVFLAIIAFLDTTALAKTIHT